MTTLGILLPSLALLGAMPPEDDFPIERGADELRAALEDAQAYLEETRPSPERLAELSQPYAPLDLELRGAHTPREGASVKNFFLGAAGYSAGLRPDRIQGLVRGFFARHGRLAGKAAWLVKLERQRELADRLQALDGIAVLAQWGADEYRVGDLFKVGGEFWSCSPSPVLGLVPWGGRRTIDDPLRTGAAVGRDLRAARPLLEDMRRLGVRALVRTRSGMLRVVQDGIADNEVGTLFVPEDAPPPRTGDELSDGKSLVYLEAVGPGAFYYLAG